MEYLSRLLHYVGKNPTFQFHVRCKALALNHLCFADDLLLFCHGDIHSVYWLLRAFTTFSASSGLQANPDKSSIYMANIDAEMSQRILQVSHFTKGKLPFKYLGIPVAATKLQVKDCQILIDRICSRISSWGSRNLSYAGRVQLINSVLISMHTYWARVFILPKTIMKSIVAICRQFLWEGKISGSRPSLVAWDFVCQKKKAGGLGVCDIVTWNIASIAKYVWDVALKADNMWVKWVHHQYIADGDWWSYSPPLSTSWYWKSICSVKEKVKPGFSGSRWVAAPTGKYSISSGYSWLIGNHAHFIWPRWVWNKLNVPKHSFICWLLALQRLSTATKWYKCGVSDDDNCLICSAAHETQNHLFFSCSYSIQILTGIADWLGFVPRRNEWIYIMKFISRSKESKFRKCVKQAVLNASVYYIWRSRNIAFWEKKVPAVHSVLRDITNTVKLRIGSILSSKVVDSDKQWFLML